MKQVLLHLPAEYVILIERLIEERHYPNAREAIRSEIGALVSKELGNYKSLINFQRLTHKFQAFKELFSEMLSLQNYTIELEDYFITLKLYRELGSWIFCYNGFSTQVYLIHQKCLTCPEKCEKIRERRYESICLRKTTEIPPMAEYSSADLEFIAKVFFIFTYGFPQNDDNHKKKFPLCTQQKLI